MMVLKILGVLGLLALGAAIPVAAMMIHAGALREANGDLEEDDLDREHQYRADRIEALRCLREIDGAKTTTEAVR
jgi:hypothetical protein